MNSWEHLSVELLQKLFLEAQGHPLPQQSKASALSRFLNIYPWSTRQLIRTTRQMSLERVCCERGWGR